MRREVIVDSSAMVATVFVAHLLNVCRSSIAHVDHLGPLSEESTTSLPAAGYYRYHSQYHQHQLMVLREFGQTSLSTVGNTSLTAVDSPAAQPQMLHLLSMSWWQEGLVYATYALVSMLLVVDVDVVSVVLHALLPFLPISIMPPFKQQTPSSSPPPALPRSIMQLACWHHEYCNQHHQHQNQQQWAAAANMALLQPVPIRISTVAMHCVLVGLVLQMDVSEGGLFMTPSRIMARSFVFTCLSVCWTYVAGGHFAQSLMQINFRSKVWVRNS